MASSQTTAIFRQGSTTYFTSSLFFPKPLKEKIFTLYAFVRLADNYADVVPQDPAGFYAFSVEYYRRLEQQAGTPMPAGFSQRAQERVGAAVSAEVKTVIENFITLQQQQQIKQVWVDAFLRAMELDLYKSKYQTLQQLCSYMYGSAEVIGLMICACIGVNERAYPTARILGRAMQYANFLRDIKEDIELGRQYIPQEVIERHGFTELSKQAAVQSEAKFTAFYLAEQKRYVLWNAAAKQGFIHLPQYARIPVAAATEMYFWTVAQIAKQPLLVFETKIKPSKVRVVATVIATWWSMKVSS